VRVSSTVNSATTPYVWDRQNAVELLVDDGSQGYLHADGLLATDDGTDTTNAMADRLGSVRGLVDATETVVGTADYAAFGATRNQAGASSSFGFTGEQTDVLTGNVFLRARSMAPSLGRFLSADTVQPNAPGTQGYSLYGYVANNPATWIDPSGHSTQTFTWVAPLLAALIAAAAAMCSGLCVLALIIIFVLLVVAMVLDCVVIGSCDGDFGQHDIRDMFRPATDHSPPPPGGPSADPGIPQVELPLPFPPTWLWDRPYTKDSGVGDTLYTGDNSGSQYAKRRLAKQYGDIPLSASPTAQGTYPPPHQPIPRGTQRTRWWEYENIHGETVIIVEHPDASVHVGTPKPDSKHHEGGIPEFYKYPGAPDHIGE
jgi:RHS repeat-associated protein